jgi:hypothetical protein
MDFTGASVQADSLSRLETVEVEKGIDNTLQPFGILDDVLQILPVRIVREITGLLLAEQQLRKSPYYGQRGAKFMDSAGDKPTGHSLVLCIPRQKRHRGDDMPL